MTATDEAATETILEVSDLRKSYRKRPVVDGVSFLVGKGEIVGLLGPNGAGKTTSFRMSVGMIRPDEGTITLLGNDVGRRPMYRRARLGMGYLAQEPSVFVRLTVEQNLTAILEMQPLDRSSRRRGARSCSRTSGWSVSAGIARRLSPAASAAAWRSPGRW